MLISEDPIAPVPAGALFPSTFNNSTFLALLTGNQRNIMLPNHCKTVLILVTCSEFLLADGKKIMNSGLVSKTWINIMLGILFIQILGYFCVYVTEIYLFGSVLQKYICLGLCYRDSTNRIWICFTQTDCWLQQLLSGVDSPGRLSTIITSISLTLHLFSLKRFWLKTNNFI